MEENISILERTDVDVTTRRIAERIISSPSSARINNYRIPGYPVNEGDVSFLNYLNWKKMEKDPGVLVLSSKHHYYYDLDEFKGIHTLINLKRLNFMNHLESFLHVISDILSPGARFAGCFADRKSRNKIGIPARIYKRLIGFLDDRTDNDIDENNLTKIFESCGLRIIDLTEINGLTYFTARKNGHQDYDYLKHD